MMETLDARGLVCPLPVLKARKVLLSLPKGAVLKVYATDAQAPKDFALFCEENNYLLEAVESVDDVFGIVIKKG